ncbi:MAG TPA: hypothetical protein ENI02_01060 [Candidatus Aminicenantes bacterium]|nr:hypothetical protein [Candidatus Aminicenantes bacterium]
MGKKAWIEMKGRVLHETEKAILFQGETVSSKENAVWLPLSQIDDLDYGEGGATFRIPEWLAQANDLI